MTINAKTKSLELRTGKCTNRQIFNDLQIVLMKVFISV